MLFLLKCCFVHMQLNQSRGEMHAGIESDRDERMRTQNLIFQKQRRQI